MKNLKLGILACGVLSVTLLLVGGVGDLLLLVAALVPTAMGALGFVRPPLEQWQALAAFAGFALAAVRMRIWDEPALSAIVVGAGLVISLVAIAHAEERR